MADWRDVRIAELERKLAERDVHLAARDVRIADLERRLAHLEERLRRSSKNSSKPPSSDGPKKTKRPHLPTGRKPGGQPGHPKHERPLAPPDKVNERVVVKPPSCERCARLVRKRRGATPAPRLGDSARRAACHRIPPARARVPRLRARHARRAARGRAEALVWSARRSHHGAGDGPLEKNEFWNPVGAGQPLRRAHSYDVDDLPSARQECSRLPRRCSERCVERNACAVTRAPDSFAIKA
jgi:hypothetical protein